MIGLLSYLLFLLAIGTTRAFFDYTLASGVKNLMRANSSHIQHHYPEIAKFVWDEKALNLTMLDGDDLSRTISVFHLNKDGSWLEDRLSKYAMRGRPVVFHNGLYLSTVEPTDLRMQTKKGVTVYR
jgi:hypothetical protein